jgi:hypothetical protein
MSDITGKLPGAGVRFARAATRHRVSKDRIRYVIVNFKVRFEEPPPAGGRSRAIRIVFLGDDRQGQALEIMAVEGEHKELLVIHAMNLREKYRKRYEEPGDDQVQDR